MIIAVSQLNTRTIFFAIKHKIKGAELLDCVEKRKSKEERVDYLMIVNRGHTWIRSI